MENIFMAAKRHSTMKRACQLPKFIGLEEKDCADFSASKHKIGFEKMRSELPSSVDVRQPNDRRCTEESCPCVDKHISPKYISFVSPDWNPESNCIALTENRASDSIGKICRTVSSFNLPGKLKTTEIFFERLKRLRRTKSIYDLGDFVIEYSAASRLGNLIIRPSGRWIFDSIEGAVIARALLRSSLIFQLGTRDTAADYVRLRSVNTRQIESSELTSYPSDLYAAALQKPKLDAIPFEEERSKPVITETMLLSCTSSKSSCSRKSTSSAHPCVSKGMLHCVRKGRILYFKFSLEDDLGKIYVANPQKIESSIDKALDYVYLFHSRTERKKGPRNQDNNSLGVVGKMKVTSSVVFSSNRSRSMETEFVLINAYDDYSSEMQGSTSTPAKSKGLSKKVAEIFRAKHLFKHKPRQNIDEPSSEVSLQEVFAGELNDDESDAMNNLAYDFTPNHELAAIVVKDYRPNTSKEVAAGGWGLQFLEKAEAGHTANSSGPSVSEVCEEGCSRDTRESDRNINVLVPAGFHGGPSINGPSSLTERWRSGGYCDCGGWDIGCPLTVLKNSSVTSPDNESQENCKSVNLLNEGTDHGEPILKMVNMNESLYHLYFQSSLSALQSFSIGVAIIHTQTPDLYPKL